MRFLPAVKIALGMAVLSGLAMVIGAGAAALMW
jgi:hypothetical protein